MAFWDKRGMCKLVRCAEFPDIHAAAWLDRKPVYFLATGVSTCKSSVQRKLKDGAATEVTCPEFIADYNTYMGGVDTHDQLRLQRYSVQRSVRYAKYYKMLFLGLFDMALVNSYIVHREYCQSVGEKPLSHALFRTRLHEQLLELTPAKFADVQPRDVSSDILVGSPGFTGTVTAHTIAISNETKPSGGYRFRVCKVCSIVNSQAGVATGLDTSTTVFTTRWYCKECSTDKSRVYLCNNVRRDQVGNQLTCFQTWHQVWKNGSDRSDGNTIRMRSNVGGMSEPTLTAGLRAAAQSINHRSHTQYALSTVTGGSGQSPVPNTPASFTSLVHTPASSYSTDYI